MFVVVAYDIRDDRRRNRLHKKLKGFGIPVQYSVFECILSNRNLEKMKNTVRQVIAEDEDLVRYYYLCDICREKIEVTSEGVIAREVETIVV